MAQFTPIQLAAISNEYYQDGYVLGRDKLYEHLRIKYNAPPFNFTNTQNEFNSRDMVMNWLRRQPSHTIHQRQRKPRPLRSFRPVYPFHSFSVDLADKRSNPSMYIDPQTQQVFLYTYIMVIVDNYSSYMWAVPMESTNSALVLYHFHMWYTNQFWPISGIPPVLVQFDNGPEFAMLDAYVVGMPAIAKRSIPNVPQSNAIVERTIQTFKRILAKIVNVRNINLPNGQQSPMWDMWHDALDEAVRVFNETRNTTNGNQRPIDAVDRNIVNPRQIIQDARNNGILPRYAELNFRLHDVVRKEVNKNKLSKYDRNNFSLDKYEITQREHERSATKPTMYYLTKLNAAGVQVGNQLRHPFFKNQLQLVDADYVGVQNA